MKYILFGFDNYYPGGNDLIAISQSLDDIIKYAESHTYTYWANDNPKRYECYHVYELMEGVGYQLVWSNDNTPPGEVIKVAFLIGQS